jgi:cell division protease FtsH
MAKKNEKLSSPPRLSKLDAIKLSREKLFQHGSTFRPATRDDVIGIDNVLTIADQLVHWLVNFKQYEEMNARPEPGVIFEGDPGTGKTLVARYIATSSRALFIDMRDFQYEASEMSAQDVADLFSLARATHEKTERPIILFWDEFEHYAADRMHAGKDQATVVSQLTAELDGSKGKVQGVLMIGCTNYIEVIDEALMRPGRLGLQVEFTAPSRSGKVAIMKHFLNRFPIEEIDLSSMSYFLGGDETAAAIEETVEEAWRLAVRRSLMTNEPPRLSREDLMGVCLDRMIGPATSLSVLNRDMRLQVAIHECGHALVALKLGLQLMLVTIRPTQGGRFGQTQIASGPALEINRNYLEAHMTTGHAGAIAEKRCGLRGAGCGGDMGSVSAIAQKVTINAPKQIPLAMSDIEHNRSGLLSEWLLRKSDKELIKLAKRARREARLILASVSPETLVMIGESVVNAVTISGPEFARLAAEHLGAEWISDRFHLPGDEDNVRLISGDTWWSNVL